VICVYSVCPNTKQSALKAGHWSKIEHTYEILTELNDWSYNLIRREMVFMTNVCLFKRGK